MVLSHEEYDVDLLNEQGQVIGTKKRREVNKQTDILHGVYVLVFSPAGKLILSRIPQAPEKGKLYGGRLGGTAATVVRHDEPRDVAARRVLATELFVDYADLTFLGQTFHFYEDGVRRLVSVYYCVHKEALMKNPEEQDDLVPMTREEVALAVASSPHQFSQPFLGIWHDHADQLPF